VYPFENFEFARVGGYSNFAIIEVFNIASGITSTRTYYAILGRYDIVIIYIITFQKRRGDPRRQPQ